jgi:hypothetical protein
LLCRINTADCSRNHLENMRCFLSCLIAKRPPDVPLSLCQTLSLKKFNSRWRRRDRRFAVTITFRTSNKNSPVYIRCWKCWPPGRMHSLQLRKTFTLWSSLETVKTSRRMFRSSSRVYSYSWSRSFKVGTTVLFYGRSCNNSVALRADVSKHSSSELGNFLRHFPAALHLKQSCTKHRRSSTVYLSPGMLLQHWKTEKCIYQPKKPMIHSASLLSLTAKVTLSFKNSAR